MRTKKLFYSITIFCFCLLNISCGGNFAASGRSSASDGNIPVTTGGDQQTTAEDLLDAITEATNGETDSETPVFNASNTLDQQVNRAISLEKKPPYLKRPTKLRACAGLTTYTGHFGCTETVNYTGITGRKLTASADVKVFFHDPVKKDFKKVAFLLAPHFFGGTKSVNFEVSYFTDNGTRKLYKRLAEKGASIVYVSFGNQDIAGQTVRVKAMAVAQAIKNINNLRQSQAPSFLMGMSMGGIIGRVALMNLESGGTNQHNVSHYVSMDSPHRGAHVPLSLQHILRFLENGTRAAIKKSKDFKSTYGDFVDDILDLDSVIDQLDEGIAAGNYITNQIKLFGGEYISSPFAQELIIQQIASRTEDFYRHHSQKTLQAFLDSRGMPKMTKANIGVSNGSITGQALNLGGNYYVALDTRKRNYLEIDFVSFIAKKEKTLFRGNYKYPDPAEIAGDSIFGSGGGTDSYGYTVSDNNFILDLDTVPCATINSVSDLEKHVTGSLSKIFPEKMRVGNKKSCFIPTTSSLALTKKINYRGRVTEQDSLFDEIIAESVNSPHLAFTPKISTEILKVIDRTY